ncbi:MAG: response regulator [Xanthomonadales bacterium]|nr:response regulator [Xanthomonadales bacterium]
MTTSELPPIVFDSMRRWQALRRKGWSLPEAGKLLPMLNQSAQQLSAQGESDIAKALTHFTLYLTSMVDGDVRRLPEAQRERLAKLEKGVLQLLRKHRDDDGAALNRSLVLCLSKDAELCTGLRNALEGEGQNLEQCLRPGELLGHLNDSRVAAILIDEEHLGVLGAVSDKLELNRDNHGLGPSVVFLNRSRALKRRLLALSGGADACLEGEDQSYLVARLQELIEAHNPQVHLKVLIVEDDRGAALYCETILRKQGMKVRWIDDSRDAAIAIEQFEPDLILMDLHMPGLDGMQLTSLIREEPRLSLLPIVFLTGDQEEGTRFDALRAGGDDYLVKPVRPRHLVTAVVTRARRARSLRRQVEQHARAARNRFVSAAELLTSVRRLDPKHGERVLLLIAADSDRFTATDVHPLLEREAEGVVGKRVSAALASGERLALWRDGAMLALLGEHNGEEVDRRAESLRLAMSQALKNAPASCAIVPFTPRESTLQETLDLAERTLTLARHGGGNRIQRALTDLRSHLDPDTTFVLQKALVREPDRTHLQLEYQPIVPLQGVRRPQFQLHLRVVGEQGRSFARRQWLDLARQTDRVEALDHYLLLSAVSQARSLQSRYPNVRLIVTIAAASLADGKRRKRLFKELAEQGLSESTLILSFDEADAQEHESVLLAAHGDLTAAKVGLGLERVSLQRQGLALVEKLNPEWIAIDAPAALAQAGADQLLQNAHQRGAEVVAHFMPDAEAMATLFAQGIDYGTGSFIGPPSDSASYDFSA